MEIILMMGPPYSGKGTQCQLIEKEFGYKQISLGELCRNEKDKNTEFGQIIDKQEETGSLVPNFIIKKLFNNAINDNKFEKGIIIDGYPRTIEQVDDLFNIFKQYNLSIDNIFNLEVDLNILLERAKERAKNSTRKDDKNTQIHLNRINIFNKTTKPCIDYISKKAPVISINGELNADAVYNTIRNKLIYELI